MRKQQLLVDTAGIVYFDCPEGRPSAATVTIKTSGGSALPTAVSAASATIDSVNTTIATWSDSTPQQCTVASATGITVGRQYLITTATGQKCFVKVRHVVSGTKTVYFEQDAPFDLAAADTFVGTRISYAIIAANTATADLNYRCTWVYTVSSVSYTRNSLFDVVRVLPYNTATSDGFRAYAPDLTEEFELSAASDGDWTRRLTAAYDKVLFDLDQRGTWPNLLLDMQQLEYCVYERALYELAETHIPSAFNGFPQDWLKVRAKRYDDTMAQLLQAPSWYDENDDQIEDAGDTSNQWSVRCRW